MRNNKHNIILSFQNITLFLRNLNAHFTGVQKIITLSSAIIMLSFTNIINTSALDYSSNVDIGFTFLPKLSITLSNPNLAINNLVPGGDAVDSNTIAINVSTNIAEGYNLFATVGGNNNTNNGYNTANLVNIVDNDYTFTSLSSNIPNLNSFANDNWGYSYCISNCSSASTPDTPNPNWISGDYNNASTGYNGLPLYTDTGIKLVEKADSTSSTVDFKIAAKASSTQPSGEYTNTINFTAVSNTIPTTMLDAFIASGAKMHNGYFKMQDMTPTICKSIDTDGEKGMQLIDVRDDKVYWVAKLKDGNCWMTQNLDLDLSHKVALTSDDTDISTDISLYVQSSGNGPYALNSGYIISTVDGETIVSWTPERSTYTSTSTPGSTNWAGNTGNNNTSGYYHPYSWNRINNNGSPVYPDSTVTETIAGNHAQSGNYYNWSAAIASNNSLKASGSQKNSICPKGWKLPDGGGYSTLYNAYKTSENHNDAFGLMASPLWFVKSGYVNDEGSLDYVGGGSGYYWSGAIYYGNYSYSLQFNNSNVRSAYDRSRIFGFSLRCMTSTS